MIEKQIHIICDKCGVRFRDIFDTVKLTREWAKKCGWKLRYEGKLYGYRDYCTECEK